MVELMKRGTSRRNNGIELVVLDEVAFFSTKHHPLTPEIEKRRTEL